MQALRGRGLQHRNSRKRIIFGELKLGKRRGDGMGVVFTLYSLETLHILISN